MIDDLHIFTNIDPQKRIFVILMNLIMLNVCKLLKTYLNISKKSLVFQKVDIYGI
jgi:hypothetical protein